VNKVFVVLAGDISNQARTRLAKEAKGPLEIFDMNWMIKNFTAYYPQVFFEGQVADFIQKQIEQLETQSWLVKSDKTLSECFVEPLVRNVDVPMKFDSASLSVMVSRKKIPFSNLKSIASTSRRIILIGDPGTGKSAALARLAIDLLRDAYSRITKTYTPGNEAVHES
jgi:predicted NACHT family NTPase